MVVTVSLEEAEGRSYGNRRRQAQRQGSPGSSNRGGNMGRSGPRDGDGGIVVVRRQRIDAVVLPRMCRAVASWHRLEGPAVEAHEVPEAAGIEVEISLSSREEVSASAGTEIATGIGPSPLLRLLQSPRSAPDTVKTSSSLAAASSFTSSSPRIVIEVSGLRNPRRRLRDPHFRRQRRCRLG